MIECRDIVFDNEIGCHIVQRVPPTEKRGRVHTSTVMVAVLHDKEKPVIRESDFSVRFHRSTGCGGQRKNKVATCCVVTHIPTGLTQKADGRSRIDNEEEARRLLRERLESISDNENSTNINTIRKNQLGRDRIRQYRFQNDEVTDFRSGKKMSLKSFMRGDIEKLW